jgi:hypothetical protein
MSRVRWPRRVWVGSTVTWVRHDTGALAPPGSRIVDGKVRVVPHWVAPSNAAHVRSGA